MSDRRAIDYIKRMLDSGYSTQVIYKELVEEGYSEKDIEKAFLVAYKELDSKKKIKPEKKEAKRESSTPQVKRKKSLKAEIAILIAIIALVAALLFVLVPMYLRSTG